jgi:RND superfamily putative drug exporter
MLFGPLRPKEMGIILGVAVALDAFLVRLVPIPVRLEFANPTASPASGVSFP